MKWKTMILERIPATKSVLTINKTGIYFSAHFMIENKLEDVVSVQFKLSEDDPYLLGFNFLEEAGEPNSVILSKSGRGRGGTSGRMVKATELFSSKLILQKIARHSNKSQRTFEIQQDRASRYYFVRLRPSFEHSLTIDQLEKIPEGARGIYRYSMKGEVVYIGKGNLRDRTRDPQRDDWNVDRFEYSIVEDDDYAYQLEAEYLQEYEDSIGRLPLYNIVRGRHS